jgi:hypothetical protein
MPRRNSSFYRAFIEEGLEVPKHLADDVHRHYFDPQYEEFRPHTMWSLSNAFTSAFKELDPIPRFRATARLASFFGDFVGTTEFRERRRDLAGVPPQQRPEPPGLHNRQLETQGERVEGKERTDGSKCGTAVPLTHKRGGFMLMRDHNVAEPRRVLRPRPRAHGFLGIL